MGLIYTGARIAAQASRQAPAQQKPKEWQPFTKCVWWFFIFAVPVAMGGAARAVALVILGVIAASVLCVLVWALGRSQPQRGGVKDPVAQYLDEMEAKRR